MKDALRNPAVHLLLASTSSGRACGQSFENCAAIAAASFSRSACVGSARAGTAANSPSRPEINTVAILRFMLPRGNRCRELRVLIALPRSNSAVEFEPQTGVEIDPWGTVILFTRWVFRSSGIGV